MAKLYFRYGAMGCGKTRDILRVWYNYNDNNRFPIIMKSVIDTKGDNKIESRDSNSAEVDYLINANDNIYEIICKHIQTKNLDCILIDEAQFLSEANVKQLTDIVDFLGIPVICYGLKSDFQNKLFPGSEALFVYADECTAIKTICTECADGATMNVRYEDGIPVFEGEQVAIDGEKAYNGKNVTYKPMCRKCRRKLLKRMNKDSFLI